MHDTGETSNIISCASKNVLEAHLLVDAPENWVKAMNQGHSALVKIMDVKESDQSSGVRNFVEISSSRVSADKLLNVLKSSSGIQNIDLVQLDSHRIMGAITTQYCPVCSTLSDLNCSLLSAVTTEEGKMEWKLLVSGDDTLKKVTDRLSSRGVGFKILEVMRLQSKAELTARQEQIAKMALEMGYFEFPKKIRLEELSRRLGISAGTLSEILRRAEKHVLTLYFKQH
ncbi:MAG: helix-turn-helix domain-containing protein [Nitrososphaerales archaeon]